MMILLREKKKACKPFIDKLKRTVGKRIDHNVASNYWGTGPDGKGKNRFGTILMKLRDEMFPGTSDNSSEDVQDTQSKPQILIIGNSVVNGIRPQYISKDFDTTVIQAFTISDAKKVVNELTTQPSVITLHLTTNDVKNHEPSVVVADYKDLVSTIRSKLPQSKVVVSNAPFKSTSTRNSVRTAVVNASLTDTYLDQDIVCINNNNVTAFMHDGIHLTRSGTSALVRNMRSVINICLNITSTHSYHTNSYQPKTVIFPLRSTDNHSNHVSHSYHNMNGHQQNFFQLRSTNNHNHVPHSYHNMNGHQQNFDQFRSTSNVDHVQHKHSNFRKFQHQFQHQNRFDDVRV